MSCVLISKSSSSISCIFTQLDAVSAQRSLFTPCLEEDSSGERCRRVKSQESSLADIRDKLGGGRWIITINAPHSNLSQRILAVNMKNLVSVGYTTMVSWIKHASFEHKSRGMVRCISGFGWRMHACAKIELLWTKLFSNTSMWTDGATTMTRMYDLGHGELLNDVTHAQSQRTVNKFDNEGVIVF